MSALPTKNLVLNTSTLNHHNMGFPAMPLFCISWNPAGVVEMEELPMTSKSCSFLCCHHTHRLKKRKFCAGGLINQLPINQTPIIYTFVSSLASSKHGFSWLVLHHSNEYFLHNVVFALESSHRPSQHNYRGKHKNWSDSNIVHGLY